MLRKLEKLSDLNDLIEQLYKICYKRYKIFYTFRNTATKTIISVLVYFRTLK